MDGGMGTKEGNKVLEKALDLSSCLVVVASSSCYSWLLVIMTRTPYADDEPAPFCTPQDIVKNVLIVGMLVTGSINTLAKVWIEDLSVLLAVGVGVHGLLHPEHALHEPVTGGSDSYHCTPPDVVVVV
jgi:hypothetical protein